MEVFSYVFFFVVFYCIILIINFVWIVSIINFPAKTIIIWPSDRPNDHMFNEILHLFLFTECRFVLVFLPMFFFVPNINSPLLCAPWSGTKFEVSQCIDAIRPLEGINSKILIFFFRLLILSCMQHWNDSYVHVHLFSVQYSGFNALHQIHLYVAIL